MANHIIAICGPRGSGKSTLAEFIQSNNKYVLSSFAYPIKKMLIELVCIQGCPYEIAVRMFYGDLKNTPSEYLSGRTPTYAMQTLGTEWGRGLMDINFWINIWKRKANKLIERYNIVIDDLRFSTEELMLRSFGRRATIVRIERDGYTSGDHQSEQEFLLIKPDLIITNRSSPDEMYNELKWQMETWRSNPI